MAADLALQNKNIQFFANFKKLKVTDFVNVSTNRLGGSSGRK